MSGARPFRVWNSNRQIKKSLVASSLSELQKKGKEKLGLGADRITKVVLESDGTNVDDEEYFNFLEDDTTLILLGDGEQWTPVNNLDQDVTDNAAISCEEFPHKHTLYELAKILRQDISKIVLFSKDQFQVLVEVNENELSQLLNTSIEDTRLLQSACQRHLDEKQQASEAMQLIHLLKSKSNELTDNTESPHKRQKTDDLNSK